MLTSLAVDSKVAASTQNQALNALMFLYRIVRERELPWLDEVVRARRPQRLPVVLTRDEVRLVLDRLEGAPRLIVLLLYGAGLRLLECAQLRITDGAAAANAIVIRNGKGAKDRMTMLPAANMPTTSNAAQGGLPCLMRWRGSIRMRAERWAGSGSFPPLGSTWIG